MMWTFLTDTPLVESDWRDFRLDNFGESSETGKLMPPLDTDTDSPPPRNSSAMPLPAEACFDALAVQRPESFRFR